MKYSLEMVLFLRLCQCYCEETCQSRSNLTATRNSKSPDASFFFNPVTQMKWNLKFYLSRIINHMAFNLVLRNLLLWYNICCPCKLFPNKSISLGAYPSKLKMSKIIPLYKVDDKTNACNYRPVSVLSNLNIIFEKRMYNRMKVFIEKHQLLYLSQHTFRQAHSTTTLDTWWKPSVPIWTQDVCL